MNNLTLFCPEGIADMLPLPPHTHVGLYDETGELLSTNPTREQLASPCFLTVEKHGKERMLFVQLASPERVRMFRGAWKQRTGKEMSA